MSIHRINHSLILYTDVKWVWENQMDLRIVKDNTDTKNTGFPPPPADGYVLSDNAKLLILVFIMCVLPYSSYSLGAKYWGHAVGTHIAVIVSTFCTILTAFLIYLSDWMQNIEETKSTKNE